MKTNRYCVIMAGGQNSGFWPLSRYSHPREILNYNGLGKSLIRQTYERFLQLVPNENIIVVTSGEYTEVLQKEIPELLLDNILIEPYSRNTSPCISYAVYHLLKKDPNAVMLVSPADHIIEEEQLFNTSMEEALSYVEDNKVVMTIGVTPTRSDTNYGYIQANEHRDDTQYLRVKTFTEKPNEELAKIFFESGEFYWNTGIYICRADLIKGEIEKYIPEIASLFVGWEQYLGTPEESAFLEKAYSDCPNISIDYGVMEKTSKACLYPAKFSWTDIGSWESFANNVQKKDENNNALCAENTLLEDCSNSLILSKEQKLVVVKGLDNYIIVDTDDALLIYPKDSKEFRELHSQLAQNKYKNFR